MAVAVVSATSAAVAITANNGISLLQRVNDPRGTVSFSIYLINYKLRTDDTNFYHNALTSSYIVDRLFLIYQYHRWTSVR